MLCEWMHGCLWILSRKGLRVSESLGAVRLCVSKTEKTCNESKAFTIPQNLIHVKNNLEVG
ncbi:hypothetical protein X975_13451, partial [Stegodyphus mimosarum]